MQYDRAAEEGEVKDESALFHSGRPYLDRWTFWEIKTYLRHTQQPLKGSHMGTFYVKVTLANALGSPMCVEDRLPLFAASVCKNETRSFKLYALLQRWFIACWRIHNWLEVCEEWWIYSTLRTTVQHDFAKIHRRLFREILQCCTDIQ